MQKLLVSFSGGRTSAYMAHRLLDEFGGELKFVFANTGCEDERTLIFVDRCAKEWGIEIVWVEAVVHYGERVSSTHRIVDFASASRAGEPFEQMIAKYGLPNKNFPHCTRELKQRTIESYMREIGWEEEFTAIGIRSDEPKRINPRREERRLCYPLAHWFPTNKRAINEWWDDQPFSLGLMEHEGNCVWCWKKSLTKLVRIAGEAPERFAFPLRMEAEHGIDRFGKPVTFFRENRSARDIIAIAGLVKPQGHMFRDDPDEDAGCSESCEVYGEVAEMAS